MVSKAVGQGAGIVWCDRHAPRLYQRRVARLGGRPVTRRETEGGGLYIQFGFRGGLSSGGNHYPGGKPQRCCPFFATSGAKRSPARCHQQNLFSANEFARAHGSCCIAGGYKSKNGVRTDSVCPFV